MKMPLPLILLSLSSAATVFGAENTAVIPTPSAEDRAAAAGWTAGGTWLDQHEDINRIGASREVDLVFLGDSITQSWGGEGRHVGAPAKAVWDRYYAHRNAANFGISGDRTQQILWRIEHGNFDRISPEVVVLMIGTNNIHDNTAAEIAEGIRLITTRLRAKLKGTRLLVLGVLPRGRDVAAPTREKVREINRLVGSLDDGEHLFFMEIGDAFLLDDGSANPDLMRGDFLHLNPAGYAAWARAIEGKLTWLLERELLERAVAARPTPRQLAWQELEFTCFIHFGLNTFTGVEWGNGKEDPALFQPTDFDAGQWAQAAQQAGMKLILLTAKHHDGFCLWPSAYTEHDVASSPWMKGKGDVVGDVAAACREHDLGLGIYLSPADLHEIEREGGSYGNGSAPIRSTIPTPVAGRPVAAVSFEYILDDYNRYFMNQLHELLTRYGPVKEVWFDGANPKPGTGQTYAYESWYDLIRKLAPDAVIAIKGPDVRWCGNEAGQTREAEWSVIPLDSPPDRCIWPDMTAGDLGSLARLKIGSYFHWYPAETNTSIRHGWFWRDEQQYVKTTDEILDIWYRSVGGNTVFLLNVPPDRRGRFGDRDVAVLRGVGRTLAETFAHNLAGGAKVSASATSPGGFDAANVLDGSTATCWMPPEWVTVADLTLELDEAASFNRILLQEPIQTYGQRIASFGVDAWVDQTWQEIATGTTVGYKRICRFPEIRTDRVRIRITESRVCPALGSVGLYLEPGR